MNIARVASPSETKMQSQNEFHLAMLKEVNHYLDMDESRLQLR